ncbi:MAG: hypothetical protein R3D03_14415 [Geminicoccaceae bacterium]
MVLRLDALGDDGEIEPVGDIGGAQKQSPCLGVVRETPDRGLVGLDDGDGQSGEAAQRTEAGAEIVSAMATPVSA